MSAETIEERLETVEKVCVILVNKYNSMYDKISQVESDVDSLRRLVVMFGLDFCSKNGLSEKLNKKMREADNKDSDSESENESEEALAESYEVSRAL